MLGYKVGSVCALFALLVLYTPSSVDGHGYIKTPRSRNFYAHDILSTGECAGMVGCPPGEYCHHCLNTNTGVCGVSPGGMNYETNTGWLDKTGNPMPWISQGTYDEGGLITVDSYLDTHHNGHMEIRACVMDDANPTKCSTPSEFEGNELEFVQDLQFDPSYPAMPSDPNYPERGMYSGGQGGGVKEFSFLYKLPVGIVGDRVLLQWRYITANSCSPPGYANYFAAHPELPSSYWTVGLSDCTPPYPSDGTRGTTWPEQFFNCAEISVQSSGTSSPTISPKPTGAPTTSSPTISEMPTNSPVVGGPPPCLAEYADCTYDWQNCCQGFSCIQIDAAGYGHCLRDSCNEPPPTNNPPPSQPPTPPTYTPPPSTPPPSPPSPTPPTGCCTINLKTCHHEEGNFCRLSQENCEGPCGKLWLPNGPLDGCIALWESGCGSDVDCCQHGECRTGSCESDDPWLQGVTPTTPGPTNAPSTANPTSPPVPTNPPTPGPTNAPSTANPTSPPVPTNPPTPPPTIPPTTRSPTQSFNSEYSDKIRVNQVGYLRFATKVGIIVDISTVPKEFQVQDSSGSVVLASTTSVYGSDGASGDHVHQADFSNLNALGAYKLVVDGIGASLEFNIAPSLYSDLPHEAMNYFYFHRMGPGMEIKGEHLIDARYAREALHPADAIDALNTGVPAYNGWCSNCDNFDLGGSWADAGDFGIYTVNHAISAWTLLNLHEMFPTAFVDGELNLPESGNGFPDVLDEVDFGSRFVRGMLPSDGNLASHKAHNHVWSAFTITIAAENEENAKGTRSAMGPSTPATYAVARVNAQLARMWQLAGGDSSHVATLWSAAEDAWTRATTNPVKYYDASEASPGPAIGGGDYPDGQADDDHYAAAVEMYLSAYALGDINVQTYRNAMTSSSHFAKMSQWDWATVTGAGTLSLYAVKDNGLTVSEMNSIKTNIQNFADSIASAIESEGYPSNLSYQNGFSQYPWGSNSFIMNRMIALAYAHEMTGDNSYQDYLLRSMDYIMGSNAMDISYVTGYGAKAETDTHDRWAWTIGQDSFWPKGWLSGGPNNELINDNATPSCVPAAKSYAAPGTAPQAWGSKENTVNWNAPLAWVSWYIENKVVPNLGGCGGNCPPVAKSFSGKLQMDTDISIALSASDYDGSIVSWEIVDSPSFGTISGNLPNFIYTPSLGAVGTDTFTYRVVDDAGEVSNIATVSLVVRDCDLIDIFQVPSSWPYYSGGYSYVHVSEDGPTIGEMKSVAHNVQWNGQLNQFSWEPNYDPYYKNLQDCMITTNAQLAGSEASFILDGCGFNGLDGEYWITGKDGNEIWVEKNNGWALVFTNDPQYTPEFCRSSPGPSTSNPTAQPTNAPSTANPTSGQPTNAPTTANPTTAQPTNAPSSSNPSAQPVNAPTNPPTSPPTSPPSTANPTANPTPEPTPIPTTPNPTAQPTPPPSPTGGTVCCADRNQGYQVCNTDAWCNASQTNCGNCGGMFVSVPLERTGCCSWGQDCSGYDPMTNPGCHFLQSDCEGSCDGTWQHL